jgi:hypothetical protein
VGEADRDPQRLVDRSRADQPLVGQADVRALDGEPLQRVAPVGAGGLRGEPLAVADEVVRVPELGGGQVAGALGDELADGVEHREPGLGVAGVGSQQRALVEQRGDERVDAPAALAADFRRRAERGAALEHRQPAEQLLLGGVEHFP